MNRRASRAGAPSCTTASCCRTSSSRISPTSSPSRTRRAFRSRAEWFAPHFEFRFPKYGDFATFGAEVELRQALEPWHVMGEEGAAGGAVRYVDSSVERLQVKVTGLAPDRYALTCNGRRIPLRPTGTVGEFVAGVRYKAWAAAIRAASADPGALAADLRSGRHLDESLDGRRAVPRGASGRPQLRHLPGERLRVGKPAPGAICQNGPHAEASHIRRRMRQTSNSRSRWTCVKSDA